MPSREHLEGTFQRLVLHGTYLECPGGNMYVHYFQPEMPSPTEGEHVVPCVEGVFRVGIGPGACSLQGISDLSYVGQV